MSLQGFERTLLESGGGDAPPAPRREAARAAVLRAAGVSAAVAAATLTSTSAAAATTVGAGAGAGAAASVKAIGLVKLVLLALLAVGAATTAVVVARRGGERTPETRATQDTPAGGGATAPTSAVATATGPARQGAALQDAALQGANEKVFAIGDLPAAGTPTASAAPIANATPPSSAAAGTTAAAAPRDPLAIEAALLEAARACLTRGDAACARARLAEHRSRFAHGVLGAEAEILSVRLAAIDTDGDKVEEKR
jgi:hypothetical protein